MDTGLCDLGGLGGGLVGLGGCSVAEAGLVSLAVVEGFDVVE